jgi:putative transcriptional regulator
VAKKSVGKRMIDSLREFAETLESGPENVRKKYITQRVKLHLEPTSYDSSKVKETREILGLSQSLFAEFLGVSIKTVQAWEQGVNTPQQGVCRLLEEIQHDPAYWQERLQELMIDA